MKGKIKSDFSEAITLIQNSFAMITDDEKLSSNEFKSIEKSIDELKADRIRILYSYKSAKRFLNGDISYKLQARPNISSAKLSATVRAIAAGGLTTAAKSIIAGGLIGVVGTISTGGLAAIAGTTATVGPAAVAAGAAFFSKKSPEWFIGISDAFIKNTRNIDTKIRGRIFQAIGNIVKAPIKKKGNTVKPLVGEMKGLWRYRFGDFRIIYQPDISTKHILLLAFDSRGSVYA